MGACFPDELHTAFFSLMPLTTCCCRAFCAALCIDRRFLLCNGLRIESMPLRGEAAASSQFELPAVHCTGEHTIFYLRKARQVGLQVGTAALDAVAVALP